MIDGSFEEFVDHMSYGDELTFVYNGEKFFLQGFVVEKVPILYLARWEPLLDDRYFAVIKGNENDRRYPVEKFLNSPIFYGKTFLEIESEVQWVD